MTVELTGIIVVIHVTGIVHDSTLNALKEPFLTYFAEYSNLVLLLVNALSEITISRCKVNRMY